MRPIPRRLPWPLIVAFILLTALLVRLLTFERYLPYVDYPDEANMFLLAVDWRGDFPLAEAYGAHLTGARLAGYPPLFPWIAVGTQRIVERVSTESFLFSGDYVYGLRLLAVFAGVLTTAALLIIGWTLGGRVAALLAGLVWALSPVVVEWNSLAIPDPLVYLASAWTLAFALWAWRTGQPAWTLACLLAAVAAIYLKYVPVHVLVAWGGAVIVLLARDWRRMLPWLVIEGLIAAASAAYLLFGYGALRLENDEAMRLDVGMAFDLERGLRNLYGTMLPIGLGWFGIVITAGAIAWVYSRRRGWPLVDWRKALYLALVTLAGVLSVSTFIGIEPYSNQMRHVLPVSAAVIGLWSMAGAQVYSLLRGRLVAGVILTILMAGFSATALTANLRLAARFAVPEPRYELWQWSDASLPAEGKILMLPDSRLRAVWNRPYSGYDGQTAFEWAFDDAPQQSTPQELAGQGIAYFTLTQAERDHTPALAAFADSLTLLRQIAAPETGDSILFYRLLPPQVETDIHFGGQITLAGYDLDVRGGAVYFRPYWRATQQPTSNYSMFLHLLTQRDSQPVAQYDGAPAALRRPASSWNDASELLIGADARVDLPAGLSSGSYRLYVGLYDFTNGQRLIAEGGADGYEIPLELGSS